MSSSIPAATLQKFSTFGDLLRFLRRRAGITQLELSIAVGYSDAQISRLEQNLRLPDIPTIEALFIPALGLEEEAEAVSRLLDLAANVRREDAPVLGLSPYKGLNYFDESDADLFVGREALTTKMSSRILDMVSKGAAGNKPIQRRFLAVVGASGSGKSSLVRAGLVPALRWNPLAANWPIHIFTPTAHPLESLAAALNRDAVSFKTAARLMDDLFQEPRTLTLFGKKTLEPSRGSRLLLVVDQFEELFALCHSEEERTAFINNLLTAVSDPEGPVISVITLRADFYANCSTYPQLREALAGQQEYIGAMSADELRRAIEEPARRGRWEFEPGLVELLLHDVGTEPGALPLLSHALFETWQRRRGRTMTMSGYASSGGVRSAIAETAEAVFADQFTDPQKDIARRIFLRLTELGDEAAAGDTRRRAAFTELILRPEEAEATLAVLKSLADARLITTSEDYAEVAHEALIREWPTLRGWLEDNRDNLRLHRHLTLATQEWLASDREPDMLYRGARLSQAREWAGEHEDELNDQERNFLGASIAFGEQEAASREAQRQRELEAARRLSITEAQRAEEQAHSAGQLRKRAVYLAGALVVALIMASTALFFGAQARRVAVLAQNQQRVATSRELAAAAFSNLEVDPERSILLALQAVKVTYDYDGTWTVGAEDALHRSLQASRVRLTLRGHTGRVWGAAFSPDGKRISTLGEDNTVKIWDAVTGEELLILHTGDSHGFSDIAYSPDGASLLTPGSLGTAILWDANTGRDLLTLTGHTNWVTGVAFSPDGTHLAAASEDRTVIIWDAITGKQQLTLNGHTGPVWGVAFSPDGKTIATSSSDGNVKVWDALTGQERLTLPTQSSLVTDVTFSPDGSLLATGNLDKTAKVWRAANGDLLLTLRGHTSGVVSVAFNPDGSHLATAGSDGKVKVWDTATGQELFTLNGHVGEVVDVEFSRECTHTSPVPTEQCGTLLATASWDGTAKVWNASFSTELLTLYAPGAVSQAVSPDGKIRAVGSSEGDLTISGLSSGVQEGLARDASKTGIRPGQLTLHAHDGPVNWIAFTADGTRLATGGGDNIVRVWDMATSREIMTLHGPTGGVNQVVFSPDGSHLAAASSDYAVRVWDLSLNVDTVQLTLTLPDNSSTLAFSPDGTRLAAGINNGASKVWDVATGNELLTLRGHSLEVWGITFSPDGTQIATASEDRTVRVWNATTGQDLMILQGHNGPVNMVAYSPNGSRLATASQDGTVKLWDASNGKDLLTLYGHTDAVSGVAFNLDGSELSSTGYDGMLRFYILPIGNLMALAGTRVTRTLTTAECEQYLHLDKEQCPQVEERPIPTAITTAGALVTGLPGTGKIVCQVTDEAGVHDLFFNQIINHGAQAAAEKFGWQSELLESQQKTDYQNNMTRLLRSNCSLIVAPVSFVDIINQVAQASPDQKFQIMDWAYDQPLQNVRTEIFATDQAAFLAGYVAASVTRTGTVGTYGGVNFPTVADFMNGFTLGVAHYNDKNNAHVRVLGWDIDKQDGLFTGNFVNLDDGRRLGEMLMDQGADIILPVAGSVGLGTAAEMQERGNAYLIGVDSDWVITYPEYADILLTSIEKRMDVSVVSAVESIIDGTFTGGVHIGTLENGGVGLASFHNLDHLVSPGVKADLDQIKVGIIAGDIKTVP